MGGAPTLDIFDYRKCEKDNACNPTRQAETGARKIQADSDTANNKGSPESKKAAHAIKRGEWKVVRPQ